MSELFPAAGPRVPGRGRLRRYGLSAEDWAAMCRRQGGVCAVCRRLPASGRLNIDHEHVRGWKKMPPGERRLYVRGLLCPWCNGKVASWRITLDKARALVRYLADYNGRRGA